MDRKIIIARDYWAIALLTILYFLTKKAVVAAFPFFVVALILGFYFFPLKMLFLKNGVMKKLDRFFFVAQHIIASGIIIGSLLVFIDPKMDDLKVYIGVLALLNMAVLVYWYMKEDISNRFLLSMFLAFLGSTVLVV